MYIIEHTQSGALEGFVKRSRRISKVCNDDHAKTKNILTLLIILSLALMGVSKKAKQKTTSVPVLVLVWVEAALVQPPAHSDQ